MVGKSVVVLSILISGVAVFPGSLSARSAPKAVVSSRNAPKVVVPLFVKKPRLKVQYNFFVKVLTKQAPDIKIAFEKAFAWGFKPAKRSDADKKAETALLDALEADTKLAPVYKEAIFTFSEDMHPSPWGKMILGSVGGIAVTAALVAAGMWYRDKRRAEREQGEQAARDKEQARVELRDNPYQGGGVFGAVVVPNDPQGDRRVVALQQKQKLERELSESSREEAAYDVKQKKQGHQKQGHPVRQQPLLGLVLTRAQVAQETRQNKIVQHELMIRNLEHQRISLDKNREELTPSRDLHVFKEKCALDYTIAENYLKLARFCVGLEKKIFLDTAFNKTQALESYIERMQRLYTNVSSLQSAAEKLDYLHSLQNKVQSLLREFEAFDLTIGSRAGVGAGAPSGPGATDTSGAASGRVG
jgi:hypothetical protein